MRLFSQLTMLLASGAIVGAMSASIAPLHTIVFVSLVLIIVSNILLHAVPIVNKAIQVRANEHVTRK